VRALRSIPADLGRFRAANLLYRHRYAGTDRTVSTRLNGGARLSLNLGDWPQAQAFLTGEYDCPTVAFLAANLPTGGVLVEGGAHVGLVTSQVLRLVPSVRVHAFEPHPDRGVQFERNIALNASEGQVHLNRVGLSDHAGRLGFGLDSHKITASAETVPVIALDDYLAEHEIETVDAMKLDVEGHELQALRGAEQALSERRIKAIALEAMDAHGDTAGPRELLEGFGYRRAPLAVQASALRRLLKKPATSPNEAYLAF
jgi:FkbM family methyltransferase